LSIGGRSRPSLSVSSIELVLAQYSFDELASKIFEQALLASQRASRESVLPVTLSLTTWLANGN